jgi:glucokinase
MALILAGDIGGTSTRLACFRAEGGRLHRLAMKNYPSREHSGLVEVVRLFMEEQRVPVACAAFGVAGPVRDGRVVTPNLAWIVERGELVRALGFESAWLLNDIEASAYGIPVLDADAFASVQTGAPDPRGNIAVIAAGTGLGEGGAVWDGRVRQPFAGEGGHASFAPRDALETELLLHLRERLGHVSSERVVSGPGLCRVYEFLKATSRGKEQSWVREAMKSEDPAALISRTALEGRCELCSRALDLFVSLYAAEAGNLALKLLATGGVYLGGGIAPKILSRLQKPEFLRSFSGKGRMRELLETIPVSVILDDETALLGAARCAALRAGLLDS